MTNLNYDIDLYQHLQNIYLNVYVECITRNPLYRYNAGQYIQSSIFDKRLEDYLKSANLKNS